jgi:beta-glucanase (GH16 family)
MGRNVRCLMMAVVPLVAAAGVGAPVRDASALTIDPPPALVRPEGSQGGFWRLTFSDEFDGPEIDASNWSNGFGWGDTADNFAAWCDPTANVIVDGGALLQRADRLPAPQNGKLYSAACLHTKHSFAQLYGYWEARIRVAPGVGLWSALWGKPADESWPPELDVEEIGGDRPDTVIMTNHWRDDSGHRQKTHRWRGPDFTDDYHVFGAEWSPDEIVWYVDGVERARTTEGVHEMAAGGPFYVLLNLQVGLRGAAQASAKTRFPAFQLVDYVRIWDRPFSFLTP